MNRLLTVMAALPLLAAASAPTIDAMKHHRRILIVAAPSASDPRLSEQRQTLATWEQGAADRDISVVEVAGDQVRGSADPEPALHRTWRLAASDFQVLLIGKDGHEALRRSTPVTADDLQRTIDAMPIRRAGQR